MAIRRVRSLLQFLAPWQTKKQNRRCEHVIKELQVASAHLRALDILSETVDGLVESGELGENSLLPMACAKERALECSSFVTFMRKLHAAKDLASAWRVTSRTTSSWKIKVAERGVTAEDFRARFDAQFNEVDEDLFGLDLRDGTRSRGPPRHQGDALRRRARLGEVLAPSAPR